MAGACSGPLAMSPFELTGALGGCFAGSPRGPPPVEVAAEHARLAGYPVWPPPRPPPPARIGAVASSGSNDSEDGTGHDMAALDFQAHLATLQVRSALHSCTCNVSTAAI